MRYIPLYIRQEEQRNIELLEVWKAKNMPKIDKNEEKPKKKVYNNFMREEGMDGEEEKIQRS